VCVCWNPFVSLLYCYCGATMYEAARIHTAIAGPQIHAPQRGVIEAEIYWHVMMLSERELGESMF
jgi:hypothetical protein